MLTETELCDYLNRVEYMALQALVAPQGFDHIAMLHTLADTVLAEASLQKCTGVLTPATRRLCLRIGKRITQLASVLSHQYFEADSLRSTATTEANRIVGYPNKPSRIKSGNERNEQTLNAVFMRDWFLRHLGHPFPARHEKLEILFQTNRSSHPGTRLEYNQAMLWFINSRRRSGWTSFLRKYANGDKTLLMEIARALENEQGGTHVQRGWSAGNSTYTVRPTPLPDLFSNASETMLSRLRREWADIVEWVTIGVNDRIGDWVDQVIDSVPRPRRLDA